MQQNEHTTVRGRTKGAGLSLFISEIDEEVAYHTRRTLQGVTMTKRSESWLMVLKGNFKGNKEVAFITGVDMIDCYRNLYSLMYGGRLQWRKSKY